MKKLIKYIFILIILFIIFIILNFSKFNKNIFEDIMILGLWNESTSKSEYELNLQNTVKIDVFTTINNYHKKVAPGSNGSFVIKFKRPVNSIYQIKINEKTSKPHNLIFILDGNKYSSMKEMENIINEKFINTEKITINWEWEYYINHKHDIQDTKDGENGQRYLFEIEANVEEQERTEI